MKRLSLAILIAFMLTFNVCHSETVKSEEIPVNNTDGISQPQEESNSAVSDDNVEQSQDQEEFYQIDEDELHQMGYDVAPNPDSTSEQLPVPEDNADAVSLDSKSDTLSIPPSSDKLFIIGIEKSKEYNEVGAANMFWYDSKNFINTYYQDFRNTLPLPVLFNSAYIMNQMGENTKVSVGQSSLSGFKDISIGFMRDNETRYDNGAKIVTGNDKINFTAGVYDSTLDHNLSGGLAISSAPIKVRNIKGSFVVGGGYYTNEMDVNNKNSAGIFGQYRLNRLRLNLQAAKSKYANSDNIDTSLYFSPELQLTNSLSVKTRFITNLSQETSQNEIGLSYKPKRANLRDLELEFNAANACSGPDTNKPKFRFMAKFRV